MRVSVSRPRGRLAALVSHAQHRLGRARCGLRGHVQPHVARIVSTPDDDFRRWAMFCPQCDARLHEVPPRHVLQVERAWRKRVGPRAPLPYAAPAQSE